MPQDKEARRARRQLSKILHDHYDADARIGVNNLLSFLKPYDREIAVTLMLGAFVRGEHAGIDIAKRALGISSTEGE